MASVRYNPCLLEASEDFSKIVLTLVDDIHIIAPHFELVELNFYPISCEKTAACP